MCFSLLFVIEILEAPPHRDLTGRFREDLGDVRKTLANIPAILQ